MTVLVTLFPYAVGFYVLYWVVRLALKHGLKAHFEVGRQPCSRRVRRTSADPE